MLIFRIIFGLMLGLISLSSFADSTILGFEDTLNYEDKVRLDSFIRDHKKNGYKKCYYHAGEDTVICENSAREKVYFK